MNNKVKILTAVVGVIVVGLGVTLMQPKTSDLQEPIVPVIVEVEETHEVEEVDVETAVETEEVEPTTEEIGESDTIEVVEPTPIVEPTPLVVAEPEPTPVAVAEPEPTPVAVAEPEPTPVTEAINEASLVLEEQATYEPAPQAQAEAAAEVTVSSGVTYSTVYNGVSYTVTQEQYERATGGRLIKDVDGIPSGVFLQIENEGVTLGGMGMTTEEFRDLLNNTENRSDTKYTW